jgi:hypothetical protein
MIKVDKKYNKFSETTEYLIKGTNLRHREDGPAVIAMSGTKEWWVNGKRHREDGPAAIFRNGKKEWWLNGLLHREDGPAIERPNGDKFWYRHGVLHREDGPAVIWTEVGIQWYIKGVRFYTKEAWFEALSEEQQNKALYSEYVIGSQYD